jgi:hypothetical protein
MKKYTKFLVTLALIMAIPSISFADNVGSCGWGTKLFHGQSGVFPQVLAITTNGTFGNQTFGISSGTSGCTQDGVVTSAWKTAAYIDGNMNKLAMDMSRGEGESLDSLSQLVGVESQDKVQFASVLKQNFGKIFSSDNVSSNEVVDSLRSVISSDADLAKYAARV